MPFIHWVMRSGMKAGLSIQPLHSCRTLAIPMPGLWYRFVIVSDFVYLLQYNCDTGLYLYLFFVFVTYEWQNMFYLNILTRRTGGWKYLLKGKSRRGTRWTWTQWPISLIFHFDEHVDILVMPPPSSPHGMHAILTWVPSQPSFWGCNHSKSVISSSSWCSCDAKRWPAPSFPFFWLLRAALLSFQDNWLEGGTHHHSQVRCQMMMNWD